MPIKRKRERLTIIAAMLLLMPVFSTAVVAQDASSVDPYSGDISTRSTLTGDWGGARNYLAKKGIDFNLSLTQIYQAVDGGKNEVGEYGGRGDLKVTVDTGKLGLWSGGFLRIEIEGNYNESVNSETGALMPVNTNQLFPEPVNDNLNMPALYFTQFLSPYFNVIFGKVVTLTRASGDVNDFAHGKGDAQFMNLALNFNPVIVQTIPYSTLGAGFVILPTKDAREDMIKFLVLQTNGEAGTSGFDELRANNLTFSGEGRVKTNLLGLTGHHFLGVMYSNREFIAIDQNARIMMQNRRLETTRGSWAMYYNFDQFVYEPEKASGRGIGIFGRFGLSDGDPNPVHYFYSIGIGGKGMIPGRPKDDFGIGYYYIDISNPALRDEYGFEAYYNVALAPWMKLTPDVQFIRGAQRNFPVIGPQGVTLKPLNTVTVLGLRLQVIF
ncbi:MAG: carbohydrate porin [Syntrophorhabdaceae bacterium]